MCAPWYLFRDIRKWHHFTEPSPAYLLQPKYEDTTLPMKIRTLQSYFLPEQPTSELFIVSAVFSRIMYVPLQIVRLLSMLGSPGREE